MRQHRRHFLKLATSAVAAPLVSRVAWGQAPQVTLKMTHFVPPIQNAHSKLLAPWARKVEAESGGRIKIDIFPAMGLGGTPAQLFDQVRDGVADLVWTLPGNTPGRFPRIEVFELPFVSTWRSTVNAQAIMSFYDQHLRDEFKEVHPIAVWGHDGGVVHTNRPVKTMSDLKGMKVRSPTRLAGEGLKALGANGIPMPIPQVPEALAQRVIDGCVVPWEVVPALKVNELVKNHTEIPTTPTFYITTFIFAMNKPKYESLPADLKAVIDANSGQVFAEKAGENWDAWSAAVKSDIKKSSNSVMTLSPEETQRWQQATQPVHEAWLKQAKERGLNGEKLLEDARAAIKKYDVG
jgi:TRAP-type C4-dicarboxylate transport system substrate-binding protein